MPVILGGNTSIYLASLTPPAPSFDPDAQAFITAAAITDPTQQTAINTLVVDLKGYSIWTKMKALYPFVGSTASQHKFNLKDPRDLDAAFRLVFSGGWTHSSTGATPNGTNAYADTFLVPSTTLTVDNHSLSYYSRTNLLEGGKTVMGSGTGFTPLMALNIYNNTNYSAPNFNAGEVTYTDTNGLGLVTGVRTLINNAKVYRDGVLKATSTINRSSSTLPAFSIVIGAFSQSGSIQNYSAKQCAFASIGDGLTDTDAANFYTAVQNFNTALARQV